jgi:hypothetical protein
MSDRLKETSNHMRASNERLKNANKESMSQLANEIGYMRQMSIPRDDPSEFQTNLDKK